MTQYSPGLIPSSVANPVALGSVNLYSGSADPEGAQAAPAGSFYLRTNGSVYKKDSGSGDTGWLELIDATDWKRAMKCVSVAIADPAGTFTSTETIPANARIIRVDKGTLSEVFNNTPTATVGWTESLNAIAGTADTDLTSATIQVLHINKAWHTSARAVVVTVGGTPNQGAGTMYVYFIETCGT